MEIRQIKETCIYVEDLVQTEWFYTTVLELPVIGKKDGGHVFFRSGTSVLLCFNPDDSGKKSDVPPHWARGPIHLAFEVSVDEYQPWKQKVIAAGVEIIHEHSWGQDFFSFYFHDPDGHVLEIVPEGMWDYLGSF
ncbi:MAG: hypothetical protein DHS20C17_05810 [Cyclobacteriaceae bacterium]|nr:MAG: hypothetical protein DHS20C17_05810 [Cyclobacteriaceae bacterium]